MKFIILAITALSLNAFASVTDIVCPVKEDGKTVTVSVRIKNLMEQGRMMELVHLGKTEEEGPISIKPLMRNGQYSALSALNDQGGDLRVNREKLLLFGDGAGYTFVDFVLFRNSGFTKGYVRVYGSGDKWYQTLNCKVTTR